MTRQRDEQHYEKRVDYVAKDEDAQTATGVVMVPNTVDHHGDWERPETIEAFAAQFDAFMDADQADGGILHSVWPSGWMELERNEVLTEAEEIGGQTVDAGAWVQTWSYNDDELWGLVEDDILGGHSIGAVNVDWSYVGEETEELPDDVIVPDEVDVEEYWELTDGIIQEVSAVDFPAVPDAQILTASKARAAAAEKRFAEHVGNPDGFIEEALERGHSEEAAQRMWDVVDRAINVDGAGEPGAKGKLASAATRVLGALTGSGSDDDHSKASEEPDGLTAKDAADGDTSADDGGAKAATDSDMSNDNEPPEWAQELKEQINEQSKRIDEALEGGDGEKDAFEEAPEWAQQLKEDVDKQAERIDQISKQTGTTESQQLGGAEKNGDEDGLDKRAAFFVPESKKRQLRAQGGRR